MFAAAAGKSTLNIPKKVGQEFVKAIRAASFRPRLRRRKENNMAMTYKGTGPLDAKYAEAAPR